MKTIETFILLIDGRAVLSGSADGLYSFARHAGLMHDELLGDGSRIARLATNVRLERVAFSPFLPPRVARCGTMLADGGKIPTGLAMPQQQSARLGLAAAVVLVAALAAFAAPVPVAASQSGMTASPMRAELYFPAPPLAHEPVWRDVIYAEARAREERIASEIDRIGWLSFFFGLVAGATGVLLCTLAMVMKPLRESRSALVAIGEALRPSVDEIRRARTAKSKSDIPYEAIRQ
jgi:hypothetical protein